MIKKQIMKKQLVRFRNNCIYHWYDFLSRLRRKSLPVNPSANFIVSIASYPKRDFLIPAVFEALTYQTVLPEKWILVLSEEDYEKGLPKHLLKLKKNGLEILWTKNNPYAVKKLIPVIEKYRDKAVITLDDDIIYNKFLIEGLVEQASVTPDSIIGYVGKTLVKKNDCLHVYYRDRKPTTIETDPNQVYLIGWGGIYYPPQSLDKRVSDMDAVHKIVPGRGSDIWFWAAAHANNTRQICLGLPSNYNLGIPIPQNQQTAPKDRPSIDVFLDRFQMTIDFFQIRDKLLLVLPEGKV